MSNCDFVAGRSRIDCKRRSCPHTAYDRFGRVKAAASRLALCAVSDLTRPNQSAQRLPWQLTIKDVGLHDVITNHGIEHGDHLAHDRDDHDACGASRTGRHTYNRFVRPHDSRILALVAWSGCAQRDIMPCVTMSVAFND
jgi:hypothetical protein